MDRSNLEMYYLSIAQVKSMYDDGLMTKQEYIKAESFLAEKYCIKNGNLYRLIDLTIPQNRVIDIVTVEEVKTNEQNNNEDRHITKVVTEI